MYFRLFAIFSLFTIFSMATQDAYADATKWADGNWGWVPAGENKDELEKLSCGTNSLSIKLDVKTKRYTAFRDTDDPILANILSIGEKFIAIKYDDEERLMMDGTPHIWIMVFINQDEFFWVRKDWLKDGKITDGTARLERCRISIS